MKKILLVLLAFSFIKTALGQELQIKSVFSEGISIKEVDYPELDEMSGLAFGKTHPDLIYTHNDSGGKPVVYVLDSLGNKISEIELLGAKNKDWEDIAVGPGKGGKSFIYVGDIGDNFSIRNKVTLYRVEEPTDLTSPVKVKADKINLTYPDGAMDAETLMVDPISGDIFILSKRDSVNTLFRLAADKFETGEAVLEVIQKLPITSSVAGDISQDGSQIIIKNYLEILYWKRESHESVPEALSKKPIKIPYIPEPQGEAIGFTPSGEAFYTISEVRFGIVPVLYRYPEIQF